MNILTDLTSALQLVARASFYEDLEVTPEGADRYRVEDTTANEQTDDWSWTYSGGIHDGDTVSEHSRLMELYESYDAPEHIRYHLPESVEALQKGRTVIFAYAVVYDQDVTWSEEQQQHIDSDGAPAEELAGWLLTANHYETERE